MQSLPDTGHYGAHVPAGTLSCRLQLSRDSSVAWVPPTWQHRRGLPVSSCIRHTV